MTDDATIAALTAERVVRWRCFHCGDTFTEEQVAHAREHFGRDEGETPVCLMRVPGEHGILTALRKAQDELAVWRSECDPLTNALHAQAADYEQRLIREEEKGYARGLKDYTKVEAERDRLRDDLARFRGFTYRGPHADGSAPTHGGFPCACEWSGEMHGDRCPEHGEVGVPIPSEADRLRERLTALAAGWAVVRTAWSHDIAYYGIPARTQQALVAFAALLAHPEGPK